MNLFHTTLATSMLLMFAVTAPCLARAEVDDLRNKIGKWVETRQIISEEESDWVVEKESLKATRDLLAQQKEALENEIAELQTSTTEADETRRDLLLRRGDYQRASSALETEIRAMETEVLDIAPLLPEPLQQKLDLLLVQIPDDPDESDQPLGQRLMNVLGILAQTEKWNSTATFVGETRSLGDDRKVQVRTLYWGLGQAFYVDARGEVGGIGTLGDEGWVFSDDPVLAQDAKRLLDIYEGNTDAVEFVRLPVELH